MSITDELREWVAEQCSYLRGAKCSGYNKMLEIADRIDARHEKERSKAYDTGVNDGIDADKNAMGYVKLPVDADGLPIRIGDAMVLQHETKEKPYVVQSFTWDGEDWYFTCDEGLFNACGWERHHAPTVEDVLREFFSRYVTTKPKDEDDAIIAEYAAKLRLAGEAE